MNMHRIAASIVCLSLLSATASSAQAPDPSHEALQRYVGTWTYEGDGMGGRVTCTSQRRWIAGGHYVEGHRECVTPQGPITQVEVFGYSLQRGLYLYWGFSGRDVSTYTSPGIGNVVAWTGEQLSAGNRCTERFAPGEASVTAECEISRDGGRTWARVSGGTSKMVP